MTLDGAKKSVVVGGILKHTLFSGNYVVLSQESIENLFGKKVDTVLAIIDGDMDSTIGLLREKFAGNNYYVIETLEAFKWEMESMQSVFDLIGTLAVVVTIFILRLRSCLRSSAERRRKRAESRCSTQVCPKIRCWVRKCLSTLSLQWFRLPYRLRFRCLSLRALSMRSVCSDFTSSLCTKRGWWLAWAAQ